LQAGLYLKNIISKRQVFIQIPDNAPISRTACPAPWFGGGQVGR